MFLERIEMNRYPEIAVIPMFAGIIGMIVITAIIYAIYTLDKIAYQIIIILGESAILREEILLKRTGAALSSCQRVLFIVFSPVILGWLKESKLVVTDDDAYIFLTGPGLAATKDYATFLRLYI